MKQLQLLICIAIISANIAGYKKDKENNLAPQLENTCKSNRASKGDVAAGQSDTLSVLPNSKRQITVEVSKNVHKLSYPMGLSHFDDQQQAQ